MLASFSPSIAMIACHAGVAEHFSEFSKTLVPKGINVFIQATGPGLKKFQERQVEVHSPFELDNLTEDEEDKLAIDVAKRCWQAHLVIVGCGHSFDVKIMNALTFHGKHLLFVAYYDNPEPFVPGGYSEIAARVMQLAKGVFFANANLTNSTIYSAPEQPVDLSSKLRVGIGHSLIVQAKAVKQQRESEQDYAKSRALFFETHKLEDQGQDIFIYFGGNNDEYFDRAFPAFVDHLTKTSQSVDFSKTLLILQQHPGAKKNNRDGKMLQDQVAALEGQVVLPKVILSQVTSDVAQVIAKLGFYYQTSMGPQFAIAGVPSVQIGHETYEDILVRNQIAPSITSADQFISFLSGLEAFCGQKIEEEVLLEKLGIKKEWSTILEDAIPKIKYRFS